MKEGVSWLLLTLFLCLHKVRLKNMLVCHHLGLFFRVHPTGRNFFFFHHFEIEKIALILIDNIFVTTKLFFRNKHQKIFLTRTFLVEPVGWRQTNTFLSLVQSIKFFTFQCHIIKRVHMFELGDSWNTQENYRLHLLATFTAKFESIFVLTQENSLS